MTQADEGQATFMSVVVLYAGPTRIATLIALRTLARRWARRGALVWARSRQQQGEEGRLDSECPSTKKESGSFREPLNK